MGRLTVAEAMPRKVVRLFRVIRGFVILACFLFLLFFIKRKRDLEEYREIQAYLEKMTEYGRILAEAGASYARGDLDASEQSYLQILSDGLADTEPYLGLAAIYCDRKWYERALDILNTYPKETENSEVSRRIREIEELVEILEQSQFIPESDAGRKMKYCGQKNS